MLLGAVFSILVVLLGLAAFALYFRVSGKTFDSAGVPIHYTDQGSGTPVVLVHGFGVQSDINWRWPGCIRRLRSRGYRVIAMDVRGHGRSGKPHDPKDYGAELSDDIVRLMDHLGIAKAHIAGYSMGGFIVLKTVERHPDRLLSAVIGAAGWSVLDERYQTLIGEIASAIEQHRRVDPITHWLHHTKRAPWLNVFLANFFLRRINDFDALVNVFKTFDALEVGEDSLRRNAVPVMTLVGDRDGIRETSDRLPGLMARHELVYVPGGDHVTALLKPLFISSMIAFFDRNSPACSA